jgi:glycosyltransferase involved in cell wall biosynthesis
MRVLRIAHASLTPQLRARERALARGYPDVDLEVVTTERWREAEVEVEAVEDDLLSVTRVRTHLSKHIQLFAYDPRPIIRALRRHRPDLIDLNAEPYSVCCAEVLTLRNWFAPHVPVVLQTCQNIFHRYPPPFSWLERRGLKQAAAAYGCSETVLELLRAKGFDKPMCVIPFGVNLDTFKRRSPANVESIEVPTIGFMGRMLPGKGLNVLAAALAKLSTEKWNLLVVGDGPERKVFAQTLSEQGLINRARFTGAVNYDEMPGLFQQIDVLAVPTETTKRIREQFGRVIIEAMASGVPVVGSTCGAIPEVIGGAGEVVTEGSGDELAESLRRLIRDQALRRKLADAGRERVEQHYSWDCVAAGMYQLFRGVLRGSVASNLTKRWEVAA